MLSGKFWQGLMLGDWEWWYSNDSLKAIINFDGPSDDFVVTKFKLPDGKLMLNNGTGDFEWYTDQYNTGITVLKVYGSFEERKRAGNWKFFNIYNGEEFLRFTEKYDKEGNFKKATISSNYFEPPKNRFIDYIFIPPKLWITERMLYDNYFNRGDVDSSGYVAVLNYLLNRKASEIIAKDYNVEKALLEIIHSLEQSRRRLEYQTKEIDGKIAFKLGEKGVPEDITITGRGITDKEKEFIHFLVSKFSRLEMESINSVSIKTHYTINLYSVNMKEFVPASVRDEVNNELFFSTLPKEKFLILLNSMKKKLKRNIREKIQFYW